MIFIFNSCDIKILECIRNWFGSVISTKERPSGAEKLQINSAFAPIYSSRLEILEAGHGKPCDAGRLREAEGYRPYRLRYMFPV